MPASLMAPSILFLNSMEGAIRDAGMLDQAQWPAFSAALHYRQIDYEDLSSYTSLAESLRDLDTSHNTAGNRIFYIALPPVLYKTVAQMIGRAGLSVEMTNSNGWSRIVVEKPFGINLDTAMDLDHSLHEYFNEHQIFRIALRQLNLTTVYMENKIFPTNRLIFDLFILNTTTDCRNRYPRFL